MFVCDVSVSWINIIFVTTGKTSFYKLQLANVEHKQHFCMYLCHNNIKKSQIIMHQC